MITYNCYIVDDEPDSIEILRDYIGQTPGLRLAFSTTNPRDIFTEITWNDAPRISFLDIEMPGISGLELASLISSHTAIIFITSHSEHALEAFEKGAYDYLVKPIPYKRFVQAVMKVQSRIANHPGKQLNGQNYFFIRGSLQREYIKIYFEQIIYVSALQNYVRIHTSQQIHTAYLTLTELEFKLNMDNFLRVHKSSIVNMDRIASLNGNQLLMDNKETVLVGGNFRQELLKRLSSRTFTTDRKKDPES